MRALRGRGRPRGRRRRPRAERLPRPWPTGSATVGLALAADVSVEAEVGAAVAATEERFGPIDLFVLQRRHRLELGIDAPDELWQQVWDVNVMAHVYAARAVVPGMLARGEGYLLTTASAAGLLAQIGDAPYTVTKHAAVGLAEWLSITYGDRGIQVSCLCPQGVNTDMLRTAAQGESGAVGAGPGHHRARGRGRGGVEGLAAERFLILPHPEVPEYVQRKAADPTAGSAACASCSAACAATSADRPVAEGAHPGVSRRERAARRRAAARRPGPLPAPRRRGSWEEARVERRERDGSIGVRDPKGAARAVASIASRCARPARAAAWCGSRWPSGPPATSSSASGDRSGDGRP